MSLLGPTGLILFCVLRDSRSFLALVRSFNNLPFGCMMMMMMRVIHDKAKKNNKKSLRVQNTALFFLGFILLMPCFVGVNDTVRGFFFFVDFCGAGLFVSNWQIRCRVFGLSLNLSYAKPGLNGDMSSRHYNPSAFEDAFRFSLENTIKFRMLIIDRHKCRSHLFNKK